MGEGSHRGASMWRYRLSPQRATLLSLEDDTCPNQTRVRFSLEWGEGRGRRGVHAGDNFGGWVVHNAVIDPDVPGVIQSRGCVHRRELQFQIHTQTHGLGHTIYLNNIMLVDFIGEGMLEI